MKNEYETSDLGFAVVLCCLGFQIASMNRDNPRRVVFCFDGDREAIRGVAEGYWGGTLRLSPLELFTHQKLLKQRIYATNQ